MTDNDVDAPHRADAVLRAFRYQLQQSLWAWLDLREDEVLLLEVAEDFTKASAEAEVAVQVKSGDPERRHSLRSADVRQSLTRFWQRSNGGTDRRPQLVFLANGGAANEAGLTFPNGLPGLEYWPAAVAGGVDRGI
jgi:hypothetical protein